MSLSFQVLGSPGRDNALLVRIDTGQSIHRLLFDCGEGCLWSLPFGEIQVIDHLFFSHLHMDHVGGFDTFFRCTYNREARPNHVWGPPQTGRILHHRFQGYLWNLHHGQPGTWRVHDIEEGVIHTTRFELAEAFVEAHQEGTRPRLRSIVQEPAFRVEAHTMEHGTPSLAYVVRQEPHRNIDVARLSTLGLPPGPWLKQLKDPAPGQDSVEIQGVSHALAELREELVRETPGDSIAYLTDFVLDDRAREHLIPVLRDCTTMVGECQYRQADEELARRNHHMTTVGVAELAQAAGVGELVLFHLSERYRMEEWPDLLAEARAVFPNTRFPNHW
jgi:ribonuclease Z